MSDERTTPTYDLMVSQLVSMGYRRDVAESAIRAQHPHLAPAAPPTRDANILEKAEQVEIRKLLISFGFEVYNLSQARASKQTPGLPDLWIVHTRERIAGWFESKRQVGGALSPAQKRFREHCQRVGVLYAFGDRHAAADLLVHVGLAIRVDGRLEPSEKYVPTTGSAL